MLQDTTILMTNITEWIGPETTDVMASLGGTVYGSDSSFVDAAARAAFEAAHPNATALEAQEPQAIVDEMLAKAGRIDSFVDVIGGEAVRASIEEITPELMQTALDIMVHGPVKMAQAVVPVMRKQGGGKMTYLSSASALRGISNYIVYCTGRGATNMFAKALAQEVAKDGIAVNALAFNYIESEEYFPSHLREDPETYKKMTAGVPLRRLGKQSEAAHTVAFYASPACGFITGRTIAVDGGWS